MDPEARIRPDAMVIEPAETGPGAVVSATFPNGWDRGILYALEAAVEEGWERRQLLISDANGARPQWFSLGDDAVAVDAVGVGGEGPDRLVIPEIAESGSYRICTANAVENICAAIEIIEG